MCVCIYIYIYVYVCIYIYINKCIYVYPSIPPRRCSAHNYASKFQCFRCGQGKNPVTGGLTTNNHNSNHIDHSSNTNDNDNDNNHSSTNNENNNDNNDHVYILTFVDKQWGSNQTYTTKHIHE